MLYFGEKKYAGVPESPYIICGHLLKAATTGIIVQWNDL